MFKFEALGTNAIVKRLRGEESVGSIIIPETAQERSMLCEVISTGEECAGVIAGDVVLIGRYSGMEFEYEGEPYLVVDEIDIVAREIKDGGKE